MDENKLILDVLKNYWPLECELVGENNLRDIISGRSHYEAVSTGEKMDIASIITIIAGIATFVKSILEIIKLFKELHKRAPTLKEVEAELAKNKKLAQPSDVPINMIINTVIINLESTE